VKTVESSGKKLILVVEDAPDESTYLTALFEDRGYSTVTAVNGNQAMEKIRENKPDLITLDISMPQKSGVKLYRELKGDSGLSDIPVLIITGVTGFGGASKDFKDFCRLAGKSHLRKVS